MLIAANWLVYVWAVSRGQTLQASQGYYIIPLFNMAIGAVFFRERIPAIGYAAMGLAAVGVVLQGIALGHLPFISLSLAVSFSGYGIVRKQVNADAQTGLFVECLIMVVPGAAYVAWLLAHGGGRVRPQRRRQRADDERWPGHGGAVGPVRLDRPAPAAVDPRLPAVHRPDHQLLIIGVRTGEPMTPLRLFSFVFIWGGAAVFAFGAWRASAGQAHAA